MAICDDGVATLRFDVLMLRCVLGLSLLMHFIFLFAFCCWMMLFNSLFVCFDFFERRTSDIPSVTPVATLTLTGLCLDRSRFFAEFDLPRCDDFGNSIAFAAAVAVFGFAKTDNNEQYCSFFMAGAAGRRRWRRQWIVHQCHYS